MARIIKKGRCEHQVVCVPVSADADGQEDDCTSAEEARFDVLSAFIETDDQGNLPEQDEIASEQPVPDPVEQAQAVARDIIEKSRRSADALLEEARQELRRAQKKGEEIESEAYAAGFEQGKKDGEEIGRKQYQVVAQRLEKLIDRISEGAEALLPQYEAQMVELAMSVARQVIAREIEISPDIVLESIRAAMEQVVEGCAVHLHLNPEDIENLEDEIREKFVVPGRQGLDIVPDPRVGRGGCLIETEYGLIDATTKAKWQAVSDTIKRVLAERTGAVSYSSAATADTGTDESPSGVNGQVDGQEMPPDEAVSQAEPEQNAAD